MLDGNICNYVDLVKDVKPDEAKNHIERIQSWLGQQDSITRESKLLFDRIMILLSARFGIIFPDLKEGEKYGVILVRACAPEANSHQELSDWIDLKLAYELVNEWAKAEPFKKYIPMVFRFGQTAPILSGFPNVGSDLQLHPFIPVDLPQLSMPIMEKFTPETTAFIVLITDKQVLDLDDWLDQRWSSKVPLIWYSKRLQIEPQSKHLIPVIIKKERIITHSILDTIDGVLGRKTL